MDKKAKDMAGLALTLISEYRLYATMLSKMAKTATNKVDTLQVGFNKHGKLHLFYNEKYTFDRPLEQSQALLIHEICHPLWRHFERMPDIKDESLLKAWNIATDAAINQHINNLPEGGVSLDTLNKIFGTESDENPFQPDQPSEVYYSLLLKLAPKKGNSGKGDDSQGNSQGQEGNDQEGNDQEGNDQEGNDQDKQTQNGENKQKDPLEVSNHDFWNKVVIEEENGDLTVTSFEEAKEKYDIDPEQESRRLVESSIKECDGKYGNIPAALTAQIENFSKTKRTINWKYKVKIMLQTVTCLKKLLSRKRINKRLIGRVDYILPGKKKSKKSKLLVVSDSSYSCWDAETQNAFINEVIRVSDFTDVYFAYADTKMHEVIRVKKASDIKTIEGGGGTCFIDAFRVAKKMRVDGVIYLTDTYGSFPSIEDVGKLANKTYWVTYNQEQVNIPFGIHLNIVDK